jgi:F plasmid transfer operon, TraF, protein
LNTLKKLHLSRSYRFMSQARILWVAAILAGLCASTSAQAIEFVTVGPRAMGMGGAGVAVTTDAFATYWNPAGLAMTQTVDIRIQGSGQVIDRIGLGDALHDLENFNTSDISPSNQARALDLANRLRQGGTLSVSGSAGVYLKGHFGEHAFGINASDIATGGGSVDLSSINLSGTTLTASMRMPALEARQLAFSYAYAFRDKTLSIGITGKIIQGAAYDGMMNIATGQGVTISNNFGKATISNSFGIDVGAIYRPSSWLRFGIVAKDLNKPSFDVAGGGEYKMEPQVRAGVAVNPYSTLTLTADVDVTTNKTLLPGVKSQILSFGAEQTILSEFLSFRVGTFKNMQDTQTPFIPTAGLGLRVFFFRADIGGGYDFREKGALVSGSLSLTF